MFALPPAHPPAKTVAGVHISWPAGPAGRFRGRRAAVKVYSSHRQTQLALVRVTSTGKAIGASCARRCAPASSRSSPPDGSAGLPAARDDRGKRYWSWVTVTPAVSDPRCPSLWPARTSRPAPTAATITSTPPRRGGSQLRARVQRDQHEPDGVREAGARVRPPAPARRRHWDNVPVDLRFAVGDSGFIRPGVTTPQKAARVPGNATPGTYRLVVGVTPRGGSPIALYSPAFTVVAAPAACDAVQVITMSLDTSTITRGATFSFPDLAIPGETGKWEVKDGANWVAYPEGPSIRSTTPRACRTAPRPARIGCTSRARATPARATSRRSRRTSRFRDQARRPRRGRGCSRCCA